MLTKKSFILISLLIGITLALAMFANLAPAQARSPFQAADGNQCVTCHESLYYLHDTGKAYCLKDAPMSCVDCHGGDPTALTKEVAHFDRAAHPVIEAEDKKCYECHPSQAEARLDKFRQVAGISEIALVVPCDPANLPVTARFPQSEPEKWTPSAPAISLFLVVALMLVVYLVYKIRH